MQEQETRVSLDSHHADVLTLAEAASYLRVTEDALRELADRDAIPARRIAGDWRFLKRALADWLRHGRSDDRDFPNCLPPWLFGFPPLEEWLALLEKRLLAKLSRAEERTPKPGTKEAVLKHFGIFKDDADLEAQLAQMRVQREAGS
jgi:excisionase family DNA binding protein